MATFITSGSETLLPWLPTQTSGPVELTTPLRSVDKAQAPDRDSVRLSVPAQIRLLVQQGLSANQIGDALGLTAGLVNSYLYVPLNPSTISAPSAQNSATANPGA